MHGRLLMGCSVFAEGLVRAQNFNVKGWQSVCSALHAVLPLASLLLLASVSPAGHGAEIERLTLQQARLLMLERNRELQLARHAVSGAEADITIAGAPPNPTLTLSTGRIGPSSEPDASPLIRRIDAGVGVTQLFERGRKRELRTEAARFAHTAAQNDQADVERQQRVAVDQAYYDLLLAQEKQVLATESASLFDKTIEAAERRVKAGDLSRADLARLSVDALRARNEVDSARLEQVKAQVALAYLIGLEREAARIRAAESWPPIAVPGLSEVERVVEQRPDVQAAQARIQQADKNRALAQSLRTRDITAGVQYDHAPTDIVRNSVGLNVSVPLFTRYYFQGEIQRAESDYLASQTALERVRAAAISQVSGAAGALGSAAERVRRFQERLLAAAEQAASGAEFAYTRGAIGVMDLLDARRQLHVTRLEYASALADYARANSVWLAATETPKSAR
jgi:cobalt-zinc-cadmium efflux system outer membrane protein